MSDLLSSVMRDAIPLYVVESGRRWRDAACRFVGPFRHAAVAGSDLSEAGDSGSAPFGSTFQVQPVEAGRLRSALQGRMQAVVFWEVTAENAPLVALTVAQIDVGPVSVLQAAAIESESAVDRMALSRGLRELGVSLFLEGPEEFPLLSRLIRRWSVSGDCDPIDRDHKG